MQLSFVYDLKMDTANFLKSFHSVNNKTPTVQQQLYIDQGGEMKEVKVSAYLNGLEIDIETKRKEIENSWRKIESQVLSRMEKLFNVQLSQAPTVYLSSNSRCTYSIQGNYFFVYMNGKNTNGIIAHELLHFYTWLVFHVELNSQMISKEKYNDVKEALTELLNTDFQDLLQGYEDKGYSQHQEMRKKIAFLRQEGKSIKEIVRILLS